MAKLFDFVQFLLILLFLARRFDLQKFHFFSPIFSFHMLFVWLAVFDVAFVNTKYFSWVKSTFSSRFLTLCFEKKFCFEKGCVIFRLESCYKAEKCYYAWLLTTAIVSRKNIQNSKSTWRQLSPPDLLEPKNGHWKDFHMSYKYLHFSTLANMNKFSSL